MFRLFVQLHQFYGEIWGRLIIIRIRLIIIRILVQSVSSRTAYLAADKTWVQRPMKEKNDDNGDDDDDDDDGDDDDDDDDGDDDDGDGDDDYMTSEDGSKTGSRGSRPRLEAAQSFEKHENGPERGDTFGHQTIRLKMKAIKAQR